MGSTALQMCFEGWLIGSRPQGPTAHREELLRPWILKDAACISTQQTYNPLGGVFDFQTWSEMSEELPNSFEMFGIAGRRMEILGGCWRKEDDQFSRCQEHYYLLFVQLPKMLQRVHSSSYYELYSMIHHGIAPTAFSIAWHKMTWADMTLHDMTWRHVTGYERLMNCKLWNTIHVIRSMLRDKGLLTSDMWHPRSQTRWGDLIRCEYAPQQIVGYGQHVDKCYVYFTLTMMSGAENQSKSYCETVRIPWQQGRRPETATYRLTCATFVHMLMVTYNFNITSICYGP